MKTIFFTADQHFGHRNIIRLCNRPFASVEEMDEEMIARWNAKVTARDTVYVLGDFLFRNEKPPEEYLGRLKGRKRPLIGNHDKAWLKRCDASRWFESVNEILFTSDGQHRLALCHYPVLGTGGFMLHGHLHNNANAAYWPLLKNNASMLNAGVDINDFAPVSFEELVANNERFKKTIGERKKNEHPKSGRTENLEEIEREFLDLDDTFRFKCRHCGKCCKNQQEVIFTARDLFHIARKKGFPRDRQLRSTGNLILGKAHSCPWCG